MALIRISVLAAVVAAAAGCLDGKEVQTVPGSPPASALPAAAVADSFAYPVGAGETVTQAKDRDAWYNALDFGESDHLGEDWNKNTGGNTDCGEPVLAAANGVVTFAGDAGPGWGKVVIVEHRLPDGGKVQTLYGHLLEILVASGEVRKRQQIGRVGNADGRYLCHLHFELRTPDSRDWDKAGGGYSDERKGWLDPSDFIDEMRRRKGL